MHRCVYVYIYIHTYIYTDIHKYQYIYIIMQCMTRLILNKPCKADRNTEHHKQHNRQTTAHKHIKKHTDFRKRVSGPRNPQFRKSDSLERPMLRGNAMSHDEVGMYPLSLESNEQQKFFFSCRGPRCRGQGLGGKGGVRWRQHDNKKSLMTGAFSRAV